MKKQFWKSDTDASLMLAAALFANIVGTEAYLQIKAQQKGRSKSD